MRVNNHSVVEICAGAGGQALGLEKAGFTHELAVELDSYACKTLRENRDWKVAEGDVADPNVWNPSQYEGVSVLAGGVPCPPFSIAGKQLGASDERDLFAWAVELTAQVKPRALILENVRGLSAPRFAAYRQRILDRLTDLGYVADWKLMLASDYGVVQLRPRFVLVALLPEDAEYFVWPEPEPVVETVGSALREMMGVNNWQHLDTWVSMANAIAPTLVGGSKKHGGADLGPTRAKSAWRALGVNGMGIANDGDVPLRLGRSPRTDPPKLTIEMVAKIQGWEQGEWHFAGGKTAQYRQIGNAFPPPVAAAIGTSVMAAFERTSDRVDGLSSDVHDPVYRRLRELTEFVSTAELLAMLDSDLSQKQLDMKLDHLSRDFEIEVKDGPVGRMYRLGEFRGFVGQENHGRHTYLSKHRSRVS